jgi:hypothetical protein
MKTAEKTATRAAAKDSGARLLDLIQGWAIYVADQESEFPDPITGDQLQALYQEMGAYSLQYEGKSSVEQDELTRRFVATRVVPHLLGFKK